MQAIILAAGKGARMGEITQSLAKPMLIFNDRPLINITLEALSSIGVTNVVIAIGHCGSQIKDFIGSNYKKMKIDYVLNEKYETTNNIYTIWKCREFLEEMDSLIIEGDVLCDKDLLTKIAQTGENVIAVSDFNSWMHGSVIEKSKSGKLRLSKSNQHKTYTQRYKTINIYRLSKSFSKNIYIPLIKKKIENGQLGLYYEDVINSNLLNKHFDLYITDKSDNWFEVDNPVDLLTASLKFSKTEDIYTTLLTTYGGLWRVPEILDFFYLSNPFFPPQDLIADFKNTLYGLLVNYPSGRTMVDRMASVAFNCNKDLLVVTNGASEIIDCLLRVLNGRFGLFIPTFDEYINRLLPQNVETVTLHSPCFDISFDEIRELSEKVSCIILVNPNNPTGSIVTKEVLILVLNYLRERGKYLIIDESFADFSKEDISLLRDDILNKYDNLFIIKSMGKSYGIPGLRLGVLFSSNNMIMNIVKRNLPIWNINSLAEHFFELFPRYKNTFTESCIEVIKERDFLSTELSKFDSLCVTASHANFIFCEVLGEPSSKEIAFKLFKDFGILLKDCSEKRGVCGKSYIRVAVKRRSENLVLLEALKKLLRINIIEASNIPRDNKAKSLQCTI